MRRKGIAVKGLKGFQGRGVKGTGEAIYQNTYLCYKEKLPGVEVGKKGGSSYFQHYVIKDQGCKKNPEGTCLECPFPKCYLDNERGL